MKLFAAALMFLTVACAAADRPNLVFILGDDIGYADLGCYGQKAIATPHLDRLAAGGVRLTDYYAAAPACAPSRSSFMTGRHTGRVRHRDNRRFVHSYGFKPEDVTIAEVMKSAGYATALCGKWHLGDRADSEDMAHHHGFDLAYTPGFPYPAEGREHWPSHVFLNGVQTDIPENAGGKRGRWMDDLYTDTAIDFMRSQRGRPFFVFLSLQGPHAPMDGAISPRYAQRDWPEPEKVYASMMERVDENVGRVMAALRALDLERNTLVIFTSDNGPHNEDQHRSDFFGSSGPWRGHKFQYYEGGVRVPWIASWAGRIEPGTTSAHVCATWDMLPTFAELGGAKAPADIDGISLVPTLLGEPARQRRHEYLYWEGLEDQGTQAVRWGDWKAIRQGVSLDAGAPFRLYDLAGDPTESRDVAKDHAAVVKRIEAIAAKAHERSFETPLFEHEKAGARIPPDGPFTLRRPVR